METGKVDVKKLAQEAGSLHRLILDTNSVLNDKTSIPPLANMAQDLGKVFSHNAPKLAAIASRSIQRKKPEELLLLPFVVIVGYAAELTVNEVEHQVARAKARKALLSHYQLLASKQNMIIEELNRINQELAKAMHNTEQESAEFRQKLAMYEARYSELADLMNRFEVLRKKVEK